MYITFLRFSQIKNTNWFNNFYLYIFNILVIFSCVFPQHKNVASLEKKKQIRIRKVLQRAEHDFLCSSPLCFVNYLFSQWKWQLQTHIHIQTCLRLNCLGMYKIYIYLWMFVSKYLSSVFSLRHSCINAFAMHKLPVNSSSHPLRQSNRGLCCCYLILRWLSLRTPLLFSKALKCGISTEPALVLTFVAGSPLVCVCIVVLVCFVCKNLITWIQVSVQLFCFYSLQNKFPYFFINFQRDGGST